jgi:2-polyprenyl-6-hydroxyphenyl methylase/3-demethylubiquinone-9 3-methyltransferase
MSARIPKTTVCLWYDHNAEDESKFYAQTFPGGSVSAVRRAPGDYRNGKDCDALVVEFAVLGDVAAIEAAAHTNA